MNIHAILKACCLAVLFLAVPLLSKSADADMLITLEVTQTSVAGGLTRYDYFLTNRTDSNESVASLILGVSAEAALSDIVSPEGWEFFYIAGDTTIAWLSPDFSFDLLPGTTTLLSITSPLEAGPQDYLVLGTGFEAADGMIDGPSVSAVPEPPTLALLSIGFVVLLSSMRHRKNAKL